MVKFWDSIPNHLRDWALEQQVFFTASAPCAGKHVNVSPKGLPATTFTIFDANHAAYIDATGSGIETVSHVYENGRVTVMFCSFGKSPRIMRFFCTGKVVEWNQPGFGPLLEKMGKRKVQGARAIILLNVFKVGCLSVLSLQSLNRSPGPIVVRLCCSFPNHNASCWRRDFGQRCTARAQGPRDFGSLGVREAREETTARIPSGMEFS